MIKKGVDVFNRLAHTQNGHNSQSCCTERKPGTRIFFWVSHVDTGPKAFHHPCGLFKATSRDMNWQWSCWYTSQYPYRMIAPQTGN